MKDIKEMIKLGLVLGIFAAVACFALAIVNNITSPTIEANKNLKSQQAMLAIFPNADSFSLANSFVPKDSNGISIENVFFAYKNNSILGAVVQATGATYDKATILIGVTTQNTIQAVRFVEIKDTSGYGKKAEEPTFYEQFSGKAVASEFVAGQNFDGISGATITTKGVAKILTESTKIALDYLTNAENFQADNLNSGKNFQAGKNPNAADNLNSGENFQAGDINAGKNFQAGKNPNAADNLNFGENFQAGDF